MYYLHLFFSIVYKNPIKTITSIVFLLMLYPINNLDSEVIDRKEFFYHDTINDYNFFLIKDGSDYKVIKSKKINITLNGEHKFVEYYKENDLLFLSWVLFIITIIILLVGFFSGDSDLNWGITDIRIKALRKIVKCEIEYKNGKEFFSYILNGRLLCKEPNQVYSYELSRMVDDYICNPGAFPIYKNPEDRREDKLNEILK